MSERSLVSVVAISVAAFLVFLGSGRAAEITVDDSGGRDYTTIQEALDNAAPGDVITVYDGTYLERIWINVTVSISAMGDVIIDSSKTGTAVSVNADDVTLAGLSIENSRGSSEGGENGIYIADVTDTVIEDCSFQRHRYAIMSDGCSEVTVKDSNFERAERAIYLRNVEQPSIEGISIGGADYHGVYLYECTNGFLGPSATRSAIIGNTMHGVMITHGSSNITVNFTGSSFTTGGLEIEDSHDIRATVRLVDPGGDGVFISFCQGIDITGYAWSDLTGLNIYNSTDVTVHDMDLVCARGSAASKGILARNSQGVTALNVLLENMNTGLSILDGSKAMAIETTFFAGTNYDTDVEVDSSGLILENPLFQNGSAAVFEIRDEGYISLRYGMTIRVIDSGKTPVAGADARVRSDEGDHYSTAYWGGSDAKTDAGGLTDEAVVPHALITATGTTYNESSVDIHTPSWDGTMALVTSSRRIVSVVTNDPPQVDGDVSNGPMERHSGVPIYFVAEYIDTEGIAASVARVIIDNVSYDMTFQEGQPATGSIYGYMTDMAQGEYWIFFMFNDSVVSTRTEGFPLVIANAPPSLGLPSPANSYVNDADYLPYWLFTVRYSDPDGDVAQAVHLIFGEENITMYQFDRNDSEVTDGKDFNATVFDLADGTYSYSFSASDGGHWVTSGPFTLNVNIKRPVLTGLGVSPATGNASTEFEFLVTYTHLDGIHPDNDPVNGVPHLVLGGLEYPMLPVDPEDDDVAFGKAYHLRLSGLPHMNYSFHARASDTRFNRTSVVKYLDVENLPATLDFEQSPLEGPSGQFFNMKITYTDLDGDMPTILTVRIDVIHLYAIEGGTKKIFEDDRTDNSTFNGKVYWLNDTFYHGNHDYIMKTRDGREDTTVYGSFIVDQRPRLIARREGALIPVEGDAQRFVCNYSDADNDAPVNVTITFVKDDVETLGPFEMRATQPKDTKYDDGKEFTHTEDFLEEDGLYGAGTYKYWIEASDGYLKRTLADDLMAFDVKPRDKPPTLSDPSVSTLEGNPDTPITFSVVYSDPDDDEPRSVAVHLGSTIFRLEKASGEGDDYVAGVRYELTDTLDYPGEYKVSFRAVSNKENTELDYTGGVVVIVGKPSDGDGSAEGDSYLLIILLSALLPIAIAVALGLVMRRRKPAPAKKEEEKQKEVAAGDEDIDWSVGEDEDYDEDDIDWE